jgi:hypothetical protein
MKKEIFIISLVFQYLSCLDICHIYRNECYSYFDENQNQYKTNCFKITCDGETRYI